MGRIAKMKRQMIMEANKRLLGEQDLIMESPLNNGRIKDVSLDQFNKFEPQIGQLLKSVDEGSINDGYGKLNSGNIYKWEPNSSTGGEGNFTFYGLREMAGFPIVGQIGYVTKRQTASANDFDSDFGWSVAGVDAGTWAVLVKESGGNGYIAFNKVYTEMDQSLFDIVYEKVNKSVGTYKQAFANIAKEDIDKNPTFKTINIEKNYLTSDKARKLYELFKYEPQQDQGKE
jgi:hypothetical protein